MLGVLLMLSGLAVMYLDYIWYGYAIFVVGAFVWLRESLRRLKIVEGTYVVDR